MPAHEAFERVRAPPVETEPTTARELARRSGREDLAGVRERGNARADVHRDAAHPSVGVLLDLAEVDPGADLDAEISNGGRRFPRGLKGGGGGVEDREHAVTGRVDLASPASVDRRASHGEEALDQPAEGTVTELFRDLRRTDHVAEPDRRQAPVRIAHGRMGSCSRHGDSQSRPVPRPSPYRYRCSSAHLRIPAKSCSASDARTPRL